MYYFCIMLKTQLIIMGMTELFEKLNNMIELILVYKVISNMSRCHIFGNSINLNTKNEVK